MLTFEYIHAPNDTDGNPQRGWFVFSNGQYVKFIDEGYSGFDGVRREYPDQNLSSGGIPTKPVTQADYRAYKTGRKNPPNKETVK